MTLFESLTLRIAYSDLVHHCCVTRGRDLDDIPLDEVLSGLDELGRNRAAAFLYVTRVADNLGEATHLYGQLRAMLNDGRRPAPMGSIVPFPEPRPRGLRRIIAWFESKLVADEATSAWMDRADREQRLREGKLP